MSMWRLWLYGVMVVSARLAADEGLSINERLFDLEAQVETLKTELDATKKIATQTRANALNPSLTVVGDFVGQYTFKPDKDHDHDDDHGHDHGHSHAHDQFRNGFMAREIEFEFGGSVDPYADALVTVGLHPHGFDHMDIHVEEAYARLKSWPGLGYAPLGMIVKAGIFRTAVGRVNRLHLHNVPQIYYPLATRMFLGEEGHSAAGVSFSLAFNPTSTSAFNIFAESIFLSRLPMQEKGAEEIPAGILHGWWHQELAPFHYLDLAASGLVARKGKKESGAFWLVGGDIHYSFIPAGYGQNPLFLLGSELYAANALPRWPIGNFTWAQVRLFDSTFMGVRYDLAPREKLDQLQHAGSIYFSHYTTEFLRFRLGYEHVMPKMSSFNGDHRLMLSLLFVLGSHPAEPYFVNR